MLELHHQPDGIVWVYNIVPLSLPYVIAADKTAYATGVKPPRYPMPVIPLEAGPVACKGLLGECVNCIWPRCEHA